ncbi:MAG: nuclear transport factor 2 family protein [Rhodobacteraceae bacterium]|nr:nuclear transport factor 2 family protein [Paracoccaceae bacterium]
MSNLQATFQKLANAYTAAWSAGDPKQVAAFFANDGEITINNGDPIVGNTALVEMVAGFYSEFPDLQLRCDFARSSGSHCVFGWTLEGHHVETKKHVVVGGWEEWELNEVMKIQRSLGWFDAIDYQKQIDG